MAKHAVLGGRGWVVRRRFDELASVQELERGLHRALGETRRFREHS